MGQTEFPWCHFLGNGCHCSREGFLHLWLLIQVDPERARTARKGSPFFSRSQGASPAYMRASHSIFNDLICPACQSWTWYTVHVRAIVSIDTSKHRSYYLHTWLMLTRVDDSTKLNLEFRKRSGLHSLCECICLLHLIIQISSALDLWKTTVKMLQHTLPTRRRERSF